ncbi:MAG: hypothetical protein EBS68_11515 [Rhodobacteraceae bacterium]|nr:hypothetical protein [Paracoccaceae bacterium]
MIARSVAETVIDLLEMVEIRDHHGHWGPGATRVLQHGFQPWQRVTAVMCASERVDKGGLQPALHRGAHQVCKALLSEERGQAQCQFAGIVAKRDRGPCAEIERVVAGGGIERGLEENQGGGMARAGMGAHLRE